MTEAKEFVRRVVTGHDRDGRSIIVADGPSPSVREVPERPGYIVSNIWCTGAAPSPIDAPDDIARIAGVAPPERGTVLRVIEYPPEPEDKEELARMLGASFGQMFDDADRSRQRDHHPGMHLTDTVDYAIVLEGEIHAVMDTGETLLRAGDILIQRGTNHAWANRSGRPCRIAFVLIDARRE